MMEFREGNEDLRCYSIKSKSSREIQRLSLLCWVKVEKGKKKPLLFPQTHWFVILLEEWLVNLQKLAFTMTAAEMKGFYIYNH